VYQPSKIIARTLAKPHRLPNQLLAITYRAKETDDAGYHANKNVGRHS